MRHLERMLGLTAAGALLGMMLLGTADVVGRKFGAGSITGSLEIMELLMVVLIFAGLPLVSLRHEHVRFDLLDRRLSRRVRRVQRRLAHVLCTVGLAALGVLMWQRGTVLASDGDTTAQLHLALYPFVWLMAAMLGVAAAVHAVWAWRDPESGEADVDPARGADPTDPDAIPKPRHDA